MSLICKRICKQMPKRLHAASAGGYSGRGDNGWSFEEALREGAGPVPVRESVLRFPRGHLRREGAGVPEGRRQPRGPAASVEDHRGKWGGRPLDYAGGRVERPRQDRCERADHPRPALDLFRQLSGFSSLALAAVVLGFGLSACDVARPEPEQAY